MDRGWYAGPVGWMDAAEDGEFCVALRSALLRDRTAHLFAGAGIVADSDPAAELAETEIKLERAAAAARPVSSSRARQATASCDRRSGQPPVAAAALSLGGRRGTSISPVAGGERCGRARRASSTRR